MDDKLQRSVEDEEWVGWNRLEQLVEEAEGLAKGIILVGFKTGARVNEFIDISPELFMFDAKFWSITLPLSKRYEKKESVEKFKCNKCGNRWEEKPSNINCPAGNTHDLETYEGWRTEKQESTRRPEWNKNEPLNDELKQYVESQDGTYLFPHPYHENEPISRQYAYKLVTDVDDSIWLHWLRAQRACQLSEELGFSIPDLKAWFGWKTGIYAEKYSSRRHKMRAKMKNPQRRI